MHPSTCVQSYSRLDLLLEHVHTLKRPTPIRLCRSLDTSQITMTVTQAAILDVPFLDVVATMSDPKLPLTVTEYEVRRDILQLVTCTSEPKAHLSNLAFAVAPTHAAQWHVLAGRNGEIPVQMRPCTTTCCHTLLWTMLEDIPTPTCW